MKFRLWLAVVVDEEFRHPRLAAIYDALDPDRSDLDAYLGIAAELGARRVVDVGCGTGSLALMLADRGCDVVAVDPAAASLAVARNKPGAQRVRMDRAALPVMVARSRSVTGRVAASPSDPRRPEAVGPEELAAREPGHGSGPGRDMICCTVGATVTTALASMQG